MDAMHACHCCLRRAPDWNLATPYTHLGRTEIYSDMLKECFDLHLRVGGNVGDCGICSACVGRLRDASDFKLQVQRSQAELQARLLEALVTIKIEVVPETGEDDVASYETKVDVLYEEPIEKADPLCGNETEKDPLVKSEPAGDVTGDEEAPASEIEVVPETGEHDVASYETKVDVLSLTHGAEATARPVPVREEQSPTTYKQAHTCNTCGKHFAGKSSLIAHLRRHLAQDESATYSCGTRSEQFYTNHFVQDTQKAYSCDMCSERFKAEYLLTRHIRTHNRKHYLCRVCDETFTKRSAFKQHKRSHKTFSCKQCNKQFTMKSNLYKHKRIHTGEKPYSCEYCNKQFSFKTGFDSHVRIHTGEKPYGCEECHKRYRQKGDLERHKRTHTGERPYSCDECDKQFTMKSHLVTHRRIHTGEKPYSCEECHKQFSRINHLTTHKRTHTGEKPYGCEVCNKQFTRKCDLDRHKEIHKGDKPYRCDKCETIFSRKSSLIRHAGKHVT